MGFIGVQPASVPLTASDIEADIINSTHIGDTAISGFTALAEAPADTDEFLISDGGVLKRIDASHVGGGASLTGSTDNTLVTVTGANAMQGEANLTFDGTQLSVLDTNEGTDNLLVKTTADASVSMALEKSDLKFDIGLDHNNDGSKNFYIRERSEDGSTTNHVRMEIDNNGVVKVNNRIFVDGQIDANAKLNAIFGGNSENGMQFSDKDGASNGKFIGFSRNGTSTSSQGTQIGYIARNGTNDSVTYSTTSDYRLKDGIVDKTDGIEKLKQLKPRKFYWKSNTDKTLVDGFLAHEVSGVVPEAIGGEKDAVDSEGNPIYQGIDQSKLVPLLTSALQEAITKIETLEARVETLEG